MSVCMSFQVLTQLGRCTNFSRNEIKDQGGDHEASIRFTRLGRLKRIRLQITDSVGRWLSVQDARDGFPYLHCGIRDRDASITAL